MQLTVLGSAAAAVPGPGDAGSGYLVTQGDDALLVDCGNGVLGNLARHRDLLEVDALLLSHLHFDHVLDLLPLALNRSYLGDALPVHAPADAAETLPAWFHLFSSDPTGYLDALDLEAWEARATRSIAGFDVTPVPVVHGPPTFGLRIERDGAVLAYSADTRPCPALREVAADADLFLCEATIPEGVSWGDGEPDHLTARQAAEAADAAGARRLLLTHLLYNHDPEESLADARDIVDDVDVARPNETHAVGGESRPPPDNP